MEQIMRDTYEGKLKPGKLSATHIRETYNELNKGTGEGYGKDWNKMNPDTIEPTTLHLQQNIFKFSMAKDHAMLLEINNLLTKNGKKTGWEEFKTEVLKLNKIYNINYLQAEWQTARQAGNHAANWEQYQKRKHLYPNLKYKTQEDDRVRDEHDKLKNVVAPIDSKFWKIYYPPNGWRCRCYVVQTAEDTTKEEDLPEVDPRDVKPEFRNNIAISGEIYKETDSNRGKPHTFFSLANQADNETKKAFELMKLKTPSQLRFKADNYATVKVNPFTDTRPDELLGNYRTAVLLANKQGVNIELRPQINGKIITGISNPEYLIEGKLADRKSPESKNYKKTLKKANDQGCEVVVFDLSKNNDSVENALNSIENILSMIQNNKPVHPNIKEVYIISSDRKIIKHYLRKKAD
ncbi:hypothetical protein EAH69_09740 [Faecalibacter macacae]|uniref:Phage head morphogenesis domain-containing protein n=2 Tax=Faecalibacter macacae TaxID=1859289 RepID=A0A3L9M9G8_9FLAO|nr:hypothetical protein EAH69_09740 [Faecalibacter macacae]